MKYTITDRDGTETQIDDYDCDCEGRTLFDIRGTFTVPQMVALANYLAKRACPMSRPDCSVTRSRGRSRGS